MSEEQAIDPNEFAAGQQVEFHHIHGCEVCAKLQRLLMRFQDSLSENARLTKATVEAREAVAYEKNSAKTMWTYKTELEAKLKTQDALIDILLEKLADKIQEVRES